MDKFNGQSQLTDKTSDSTDKFNCQNQLDIAVANALELLRGPTLLNWPAVTRDPRTTGGMKNMSKVMAKMSTVLRVAQVVIALSLTPTP
jgi:hypothetical protein